MKTEDMSLEQIRAAGMQALSGALGPVGLIRFLQLFERESGDYSTARHTELVARDLSLIHI